MSATKRKPTRARGLGVTDADYKRLLDAQDGHCALCPTEPRTRRLHVDHDHRTGKVRGLLCYHCNRVITTRVNSDFALRLFGYLKNAEQDGAEFRLVMRKLQLDELNERP